MPPTEATPAMIEAGLCVLEQRRESYPDFSVVAAIYSAMETVRLQGGTFLGETSYRP